MADEGGVDNKPLSWLLAWVFGTLAAVLVAALFVAQIRGPVDDWLWVGTLGEWLAAFATVGAVGATIWLAWRDRARTAKEHSTEMALLREQVAVAKDDIDQARSTERDAELNWARHLAEHLLLEWDTDWVCLSADGIYGADDPLVSATITRLENTGKTPFYNVEVLLVVRRPADDMKFGVRRLGTIQPGEDLAGRSRGGLGLARLVADDLLHGGVDMGEQSTQSVISTTGLAITYEQLHDLPIDFAIEYDDTQNRRWRRRQSRPVELTNAPPQSDG